MNKHLLISFALLGLTSYSNAQEDVKSKQEMPISTNESMDEKSANFNKFSLEVDCGESKGLTPYFPTGDYYGSDPDKVLGGFQFNHYGIAGRWMFSPVFGIKSHISFDDLKNLKTSDSKDFQMYNYQISLEGVVNLSRLFNIQEQLGRFGMLFHFGFHADRLSPQLGPRTGHGESNGGFVLGFTPQFRITKNISIFTDFTLDYNNRQHYTWDGHANPRNNNLTGSMMSSALGLSFSFGKGSIHGDYAIIEDHNAKIDELSARVGEIETMMNDADKDGVPDYLDVENNSLAGVAVDSKGRMVDLNSNGVPDQLEKYVETNVAQNNAANTATVSNDVLEKLINDGYIASYFDLGKSVPNAASTQNIGFILNYLKNNPTKSIEIIGYADETGSEEFNAKLTKERAENVKTIFVKAGIDPSRLSIIGNGVDKSVDKDSEYPKSLVRKAVFKIK